MGCWTSSERARSRLPNTALHMLSNGRLFNYLSLCREIAAIEHPDLMVGIPLYSDIPHRHDFVVQADGAFDQTIRGMMNLARCGISGGNPHGPAPPDRRPAPAVRAIHRPEPPLRGPRGPDGAGDDGLRPDESGFPVGRPGRLSGRAEARGRPPAASTASTSRSTTTSCASWIATSGRSPGKASRTGRTSTWTNAAVASAQDRCGGFFASSSVRRSDHIRRLGPEMLSPDSRSTPTPSLDLLRKYPPMWNSLLVSALVRHARNPAVRTRIQALRPHRDEGRLRRGDQEGEHGCCRCGRLPARNLLHHREDGGQLTGCPARFM